MDKITILIILIGSSILSGCTLLTPATPKTNDSYTFECPDTDLYDFNQEVNSKEKAITLLKQFFSEKNGYASFDQSKVIGPEDGAESYIEDAYIYIDRYGISGAGGVLYNDGKLVKKGYCK